MSATPTPTSTHFHVLLDRSGSMQVIRDDVIGGFNAFLAEQAADGDDARMTLVQFDTQDPQQVLADGVPLAEVTDLDTSTYVPRGGTPLLDATGDVIGRATARQAERAALGQPPEEVIVVTVTDGHENQSRRFTKDQVRDLIAERETWGWTFVYLSADFAAYDDAAALGYDPRSVSEWKADAAGAQAAFSSVSRAASAKRKYLREGRTWDKGDFFEGTKEAEE